MQETVIFRNGIKMTTQSLLPNDLIDALLSNYKKPEDLIGENGLFAVKHVFVNKSYNQLKQLCCSKFKHYY